MERFFQADIVFMRFRDLAFGLAQRSRSFQSGKSVAVTEIEDWDFRGVLQGAAFFQSGKYVVCPSAIRLVVMRFNGAAFFQSGKWEVR